ncbi:MAG: hypothetical protein V1809_05415 [Planctomycetota bacterium]
MFVLMDRHFNKFTRDDFERDLAEKTWVILIEDEMNVLQGFSTLRILEAVVRNIPVSAFYSGDTIVDRDSWGTSALARAWVRFVLPYAEERPGRRWHWFVVCKGFRTYRYLPVFFRDYLPRRNAAPRPFEKEVLDALAFLKFKSHYNPASGVITRPSDYCLREGISDIGDRELRNPHIAFFQKRNPHWRNGSELACLTRLCRTNLKPRALTLLEERENPAR